MANENKDIIRIETSKASMPATLRNQQTGYCNDTYEIAHKFADGTMIYYSANDVISIDATQVAYTNVADGAIATVNQALDAIYEQMIPFANEDYSYSTLRDALNDILLRIAALEAA